MDEPRRLITVEVAYALPDAQPIIALEMDAGASVKEAIMRSGLLAVFPDIDLTVNKVGIFGKLTRLTAVLKERDRVEIYRPLLVDPKESRKQRAAQKNKR